MNAICFLGHRMCPYMSEYKARAQYINIYSLLCNSVIIHGFYSVQLNASR